MFCVQRGLLVTLGRQDVSNPANQNLRIHSYAIPTTKDTSHQWHLTFCSSLSNEFCSHSLCSLLLQKTSYHCPAPVGPHVGTMTALRLFLLLCTLVAATSAFVVPGFHQQQTFVSSASSLQRYLHPSQAADLEACAYDLMKEAAEDHHDHDDETKVHHRHNGPIAWCKRVWQRGNKHPRSRSSVHHHAAAAANNKNLKP